MNVDGFSVTAFLKEISRRLDVVSAVARAGLECAERGTDNEAIGVIANLDSALQDISSLHSALLVIRRTRRVLV